MDFPQPRVILKLQQLQLLRAGRVSYAVCKEMQPASPARADLSLGRWIRFGEGRRGSSFKGRGTCRETRQPLEAFVIDLEGGQKVTGRQVAGADEGEDRCRQLWTVISRGAADVAGGVSW